MSDQTPTGPQEPTSSGPGPQPSQVPPAGDAEERRRLEEWQRYQEWQRHEQWRRQQWEQWQAWQQEEWRRQWEAHHQAHQAHQTQLAQQRGDGQVVEPPRFPHAEPTPYHLVQRTWTYHWWRPLVGIVLLVVGMLLVVPFLTLPVLLVGVAFEAGPGLEGYFDALTRALDLTELSPSGLLWLNLSLGGLILWTWLLNRYLHNLRPGWLTSVVPKMRWRFFWACMGISVVVLVAQVLLSLLIPFAGDPTVESAPNPVTGETIALLVVVLLTTPLQATGEEYAFRGYLLQAVGALSKRAWLALVITSLLFAAAHGIQNFPLFFDRFMFGLIAGWLVIRTGGLESGIALHILNNLVAFGLGIFYGDINEMLTVAEISWWNVPVTLTQSVLYVVLVLVVARRMQVQRTSRPPVAEEPDRQLAPVG